MNSTSVTRSASALALALGLAACSTGAGPASSASQAAGAASPAASASATALDAAATFTGTDRCFEAGAPASPDPKATYETCHRTSSDSRMDGTVVYAVYSTDDTSLSYGTATMTTAAGGWDCKFLTDGTALSGAGWRDETCVGLGGYMGVTAYIHAIGADYAKSDGYIGWIVRTP